MNTLVFLRMVPDIVEELEISSDGKSLDTEWLRMILSEPSDHALEQAVFLKEAYGGTVTAVALEGPETDDALYRAIAKGVDKAVKITGDFEQTRSPLHARAFTTFLQQQGLSPDSETVILTGSYATDDLAGEVGPHIAQQLRLPYIGVVTGLKIDQQTHTATVIKEFASGRRGEFEVPLPAVLGIQTSEQPENVGKPRTNGGRSASRYVPVSTLRAAMKSGEIHEVELELSEDHGPSVLVERMYKPETAAGAEMIEGDPETAATRLVEILEANGVL